MRTLLAAIQTQLRSDLTYVRDQDVYITPHPNYVPRGVQPPFIGLKDGPVARRELAGGWIEVTRQVLVVVYTALAKEEASVMGDAAAGQKGVLEIEEDVHASLDENLLSIDGMQSAWSPSAAASEMFGDAQRSLQRKIITYEYIGEEER